MKSNYALFVMAFQLAGHNKPLYKCFYKISSTHSLQISMLSFEGWDYFPILLRSDFMQHFFKFKFQLQDNPELLKDELKQYILFRASDSVLLINFEAVHVFISSCVRYILKHCNNINFVLFFFALQRERWQKPILRRLQVCLILVMSQKLFNVFSVMLS